MCAAGGPNRPPPGRAPSNRSDPQCAAHTPRRPSLPSRASPRRSCGPPRRRRPATIMGFRPRRWRSSRNPEPPYKPAESPGRPGSCAPLALDRGFPFLWFVRAATRDCAAPSSPTSPSSLPYRGFGRARRQRRGGDAPTRVRRPARPIVPQRGRSRARRPGRDDAGALPTLHRHRTSFRRGCRRRSSHRRRCCAAPDDRIIGEVANHRSFGTAGPPGLRHRRLRRLPSRRGRVTLTFVADPCPLRSRWTRHAFTSRSPRRRRATCPLMPDQDYPLALRRRLAGSAQRRVLSSEDGVRGAWPLPPSSRAGASAPK